MFGHYNDSYRPRSGPKIYFNFYSSDSADISNGTFWFPGPKWSSRVLGGPWCPLPYKDRWLSPYEDEAPQSKVVCRRGAIWTFDILWRNPPSSHFGGGGGWPANLTLSQFWNFLELSKKEDHHYNGKKGDLNISDQAGKGLNPVWKGQVKAGKVTYGTHPFRKELVGNMNTFGFLLCCSFFFQEMKWSSILQKGAMS